MIETQRETEAVWRNFAGPLRAYVARRAPDAVDDLVQEVFVKVQRRAQDGLPQGEHLPRWLFRVASTTVIDHVRRQGREVELVSEPAAPATDDDTSRELERGLGAWLRAEIEALEEPYRSTLRAVEVEGHTQKQVAAQAGLPYATVKARVQRGRAQLARRLDRCCEVARDARGGVLSVERRGAPCACPAPDASATD